MGNPIAAGPSSQALTGGHKKFSARLGDEAYDFGGRRRGFLGATQYGCCGAPWRDVRLMVFALAMLYAFVSLFYWGLLTVAMEVRQEEWLELQDDFFGPFSKVERPLYNSSNQPVPVRIFTIAEFEKLRDADQGIFSKTFNRPNGCEEERGGDGAFLECDRDNEEDGRWFLFPWVSDKLESGALQIEGCGTPSPEGGRRTWSSLELDGSYGSPQSTPEDTMLGPNTCLTYVPISATPS